MTGGGSGPGVPRGCSRFPTLDLEEFGRGDGLAFTGAVSALRRELDERRSHLPDPSLGTTRAPQAGALGKTPGASRYGRKESLELPRGACPPRAALPSTGSEVTHMPQDVLRDASALGRDGGRAGRPGSTPSRLLRAGAAQGRVLRGGSDLGAPPAARTRDFRSVLVTTVRTSPSSRDAHTLGTAGHPHSQGFPSADGAPALGPAPLGERNGHENRQEGNLLGAPRLSLGEQGQDRPGDADHCK